MYKWRKGRCILLLMLIVLNSVLPARAYAAYNDIYESPRQDVYNRPKLDIYPTPKRGIYNDPWYELYHRPMQDIYRDTNMDIYPGISQPGYTQEESAGASLKALYVDGSLIPGFDAYNMTYTCEIPPEKKGIPKVTAFATDPYAIVTVEQAKAIPGTATVMVTARDYRTVNRYFVNFSYKVELSLLLNSLTLSQGSLVPGFSPNILLYNVELPPLTKKVPAITAVAQDGKVQVSIEQAKSLPGSAQVIVSSEGGDSITYTVRFTVKPILSKTAQRAIIIAGVVLLILIVVITFILGRRKGKKQTKEPKKNEEVKDIAGEDTPEVKS